MREVDYVRPAKRMKVMDSQKEFEYVRTPAKRMKMMDSEEEEGKGRILSKFPEFRSIAYFRRLSDPFRLMWLAVRISEKMCMQARTFSEQSFNTISYWLYRFCSMSLLYR
jgi:hypothetical protein